MSFLKPKKQPDPKPAPPPPERSDTQVTAAAEEQRRRYSSRSAANLLTSGLGVTDTPQTSAASLLGQTGRV